MSDKHAPAKFSDRICMHMTLWCMSCLQLVSGQAVGTLFDLEESRYMQERMEAEPSIKVHSLLCISGHAQYNEIHQPCMQALIHAT